MIQEQNANQNNVAEVVSGELTLSLMEAELVHVIEELRRLQLERVSIAHWSGEAEVAVSELTEVFQCGIKNPLITTSPFRDRLGFGDFYLYAEGVGTQFEFCHHKELHVISDDECLLERFFLRWQSLGYVARRMPLS